MTPADMDRLIDQFAAARRSLEADFQVIELHMDHGCLLYEFLSPLTNQRTDQYGGSLENRIRFPLQIASAVRSAWPEALPLFVRLPCTDWVEGETWRNPVELARRLKKVGVDLIDFSVTD